jgi:hypothetical protein
VPEKKEGEETQTLLTVDRQFVICHAHISLIRLRILMSDLQEYVSLMFIISGDRMLTGSSSAVGGASMKDWRIGRLKFVDAQRMKRFKSVLDIPPIGLMSADEQSYFVTNSTIRVHVQRSLGGDVERTNGIREGTRCENI